MPNELLDKLNNLTEQLDRADDPELSAKIKPLIDQTQLQLEQSGLEDPINPPLSDVFNELVTELEVEHPTITQIVADIALKLSSMGI